ncbi:MAG TPA: rod shape-determining protein MreD [Candidatus Binatia bacterium]|nr:rod shape-determining protein MreD [Candidatus Binatia bacterium]
MRSFLALAVASVAAMLLQTTVFRWVPRAPTVPDLLLVLAVYIGSRHHSVPAVCGVFLLGYFVDTFSGTLLGMNAFAFTAVYAAVYLVARNLWMERGLPVMAVVFFGAYVRVLAALLVSTFVAAREPLWHHVVRWGLLEATLAALVAPAVFGVVSWEKRLLGVA